MPYNSNSELPKGVKGLPAEQQTKWRKVFNSAYEGTCKSSKDRDKCASKVAWSQIGDKYKNNAVVEFSLALTSATHNKKEGTLRWKAVASDTDEDFYHDNMSMELFNDFVSRININELAPQDFRSSYWQGGMPYLSVSHYPDLEGDAVPGSVQGVFIDGVKLKAEGEFSKTPLGLSCYHAICKDLYEEPKPENPVRVSIAFLDYGHEHKSNGEQFVRESLDDVCPECIKEHVKGEHPGKIFKKGQLVHLALTRVPANERTSMEVDKSMTTRKEDAASIVGEELADEIDEKAVLVGKSEALVIKSDEEPEEEEVLEAEEVEVEEEEPVLEELAKPMDEEDDCPEDMSEEDCKKHKQQAKSEVVEEAVIEEKATKKEADCSHPSSHYLVVEDASKPSTWHLRVKNCAGKPDHRLMAAARAALTSNYRGHAYGGPNKSAALSKLKGMYKSEGMDWEKKSIDDIDIRLDYLAEMLSQTMEREPIMAELKTIEEHELDAVFSQFKSAFDEVKMQPITPPEKLQLLQDAFNQFGNEIRNRMSVPEPQVEETPAEIDQNDLVTALSTALSNALTPLASKIDVLIESQKSVVKSDVATPVRRSIAPQLSMQTEIRPQVQPVQSTSATPKLHEIIRKSVGLQ